MVEHAFELVAFEQPVPLQVIDVADIQEWLSPMVFTGQWVRREALTLRLFIVDVIIGDKGQCNG